MSDAHPYEQTTYIVDVPDGEPIGLRIGECSEALDRLLASWDASCWMFITAWNPRGRRTTSEENAARNASLLRLLEDEELTYFSGRGVGDLDDWQPEESFLVLHVGRDAAARWCEQFEQRAVVIGRRGEAPELLWNVV